MNGGPSIIAQVQMPYPVLASIIAVAALTVTIVYFVIRLAPEHGPLVISVLVVVAFIGATGTAMIYTIPSDEATSVLVGALTSGFAAVVTYWLSRKSNGGNR